MIHSLFRLHLFFWSFLAFSSALSANQDPVMDFTLATESCSFSKPLLEVKTGYFSFSDSKLRKVYDRGGAVIQLSATYPLWNFANGWTLNGYGALEYVCRSGKSINEHQKTSLRLLPIDLGLKPAYAINANIQYYFAVGPRYFYLHQHNHSSYVYRNKSRNTVGFFVNTGFNYFLCDHFVIDIFGEYSSGKLHFHGGKSRVYARNVQIGGFTCGGGLGYHF